MTGGIGNDRHPPVTLSMVLNFQVPLSMDALFRASSQEEAITYRLLERAAGH